MTFADRLSAAQHQVEVDLSARLARDARVPHRLTQAMQHAARAMKSFIFVGCGDTTDDPNFGALLKWSQKVFHSSEILHYRLALNSEVQKVQKNHLPEERIRVLGYGNKHSDL